MGPAVSDRRAPFGFSAKLQEGTRNDRQRVVLVACLACSTNHAACVADGHVTQVVDEFSEAIR